MFHSLASRCSLDLWRSLSGAPPGSFSESALRLPAFLAGCLGIAALGLALRALGLPHAGALAAALAAVHPWHIRYSTEARGYALVLLLAPLLVTLAAGTLRDGRWRWWFGFAFAEAALLASFPGALPLAAALSLALGAAILLDAFPLLDAGPAFARFVVSHVVAAMGFLWLMAPSLPQIHAFLHADRMRSGPGWETARSIWSHLALGMNWASGPVENPLILSVPGPGWVAGPLAVALVVAVIPALILLGLRRLARLGSGPFLVGIALAAALPMACAHLWLNRSTVLVWYLIFALPGLLLLVAAGLSPGRSDDFERVRLSRHGGTWGAWRHVPGIVFLTLFVASTHRQAAILMHHPKEDLRGTARWVRGEPAEGAIGVIFWSNAPVYDPGLRVVWNAAELWRWMERASAEGRPLRVGYGHRPMSNQNDATRALLALAEDPRYFDPVAVLPGLDEDQFTHRVNAFKAAGLAPPEHDRVE